MEEKLKNPVPDFDEWLANYVEPEKFYLAGFDNETGSVKVVGPDYSIDKKRWPNTIPVDADVAEMIISGEIKLSNCFVDQSMGTLEITEVKSLFKIDDLLHRIIDKRWSDVKKPDVFLTFNQNESELKIELSEEFGGTKILADEFQPVTKRKIFWDGETKLNFLITAYNDPHIIYQEIETTISDITNSITVDIECTEKFSIYTRRLFKNYVVEVL